MSDDQRSLFDEPDDDEPEPAPEPEPEPEPEPAPEPEPDTFTFGPDTTLGAAQDWLRRRIDDGASCPCCGQLAKVYRRKLTASIASVLIKMHYWAGADYAYLPNLRSKGQDEVIARHWGLIEGMPDVRRDDGSTRVGWWRLTALGRSFVLDQARVPKYARIYNNRLLNLDDAERVSIRDALGTSFNYDDLMAGK